MAIIGHYSSLTEVQRIVDDVLIAGVIEEIIEEGHLLPRLPVTHLSGKSLIYNREKTLPQGEWVSIGDTLTSEHVVDYDPVTVTLKRQIGQGDLDHFVADTYDNPIDPRTQAIKEARKGVMRALEDTLIYGNATTYPKEPDGLHALVDSAMKLNQGSSATGAALSLDNLDQLIDLVKPKPDFLLCSFAVFRRMSQAGRGGSTNFPLLWIREDKPGVAGWITSYRDIPLIRSDFMLQTETIASSTYSAKTGGATSSIFAIRTGPVAGGGLSMLLGNELFELVEFSDLEDKDAMRYRLKTYVALALGSTKSLARLDGITDARVGV